MDNKHTYYLVLGIGIPFFGRIAWDILKRYIWLKITNYICGGDPCKQCFKPDETSEYVVLEGGGQMDCDKVEEQTHKVCPDGVNVFWIMGWLRTLPGIHDVNNTMVSEKSSWGNARKLLGWTWNMAFSVSMLRLFLWHLMQPIAYVWTFYTFYEDISPSQQILGGIVAIKEISYFLLAIYATIRSPRYLLTNLAAGWKTGSIPLRTRIISMYVFGFCPEKFLLYVMYYGVTAPACEVIFFVQLFILSCCEVCALIALTDGLMCANLPLPLAISYGVTGLAGLFVPVTTSNTGICDAFSFGIPYCVCCFLIPIVFTVLSEI